MKFTLSLLMCIASSIVFGQNSWIKINENEIVDRSVNEREIVPDNYEVYSLDFDRMKKVLSKAMHENQKGKTSGISFELPLPSGQFETFEFFESPCMSKVLASKFPSLKSYRGVSTVNPAHHAKVDFGPMGFHAVISSMEGTIYVDPYFKNPDDNYISYYIRDHHVDLNQYTTTCGISKYKDEMANELNLVNDVPEFEVIKSSGAEVSKRTYRIAVATTGEWGSNYGTKENVMARILTGVNRLNMIFENEIASTFELIDNNDELIFLDPLTDPYVDANLGRSLIGQNSIAINNIVGQAAYDIGHIFTVNCIDGVAGIAALGSVCLGNKGNGVSCVGNSNISAFMVNTTAHEIGHQFSGGHSWSNCPNAQGQLSPGTAWEPGSGSTILSYAGVCGSQNIVGTNDDYFHVGNVDQFKRFIETTGNCAAKNLSGNHTPDVMVELGDGVIIPIATPFELEGVATDEDGDVLTYNWEQMDLGPTSSLGDPMGNSPSFRSFPPTTNPNRLFPRLPAIIGGIGSNLEVLPLYSRDLTFRFTVRDNHPGAGSTVWEEIEFKATDTAGPFRITSPNSLTFVEVGQELNLEWDVANTDNDLVNCQFVDIYLSLDNAKTFPILLKGQTPNDGSESVIIPNNFTNEGKIKIKASNNIFFQFNRSNIVIRQPQKPGFYIDVAESRFDVCLPDIVELEIHGTSFQEFDNPVSLDVTGLPEGASFEFSENPFLPSESTKLIIDLSGVSNTQSFDITLEGIAEEADTISQIVKFNVTGTNFEDLVLTGPESGLSGLKQTPSFSWSKAANAETYTLEVAESPKFGTTNVISESFIPDTSFIPQIVLDNSKLYYWRVIAQNQCIDSSSEIRTFGTVSLECKNYIADNLPKNISFSGIVTVDATARVFDVGEVADVNIIKVKGQHSNVFQLTGTLISPAGTKAVMFDTNCFASTDFNIGFDSDSPIDFTCPLNSGLTVKPNVTDLSVFNGELIDGDWIFRIKDNQGGEGGQFSEFELELCASFEIDNPFVVNNNQLDVPTGLSAKILNQKLLVDDANNGPSDLLYTLVVVPTKGSLRLNNEALKIGDQFTQTDLNNEKLRYVHEGNEEASDAFVFTVVDGEGGWLDLTEFVINIGDDIISSNEDELLPASFEIFPNPTNNLLHINAKDKSLNWEVKLFSIDGQLKLKDTFKSQKSLSLSDFSNGIYFLKISNKNQEVSFRINVIK